MEKNQNYLIVFGVSGSGKTSVGEMLAAKLKIDFIEGDDLHPKSNIDKMKNGIALTDADRLPWLSIIKEKLLTKIIRQENFVLSCSALKVSYRDILREAGNIKFLFLKVGEEEVAERLENREGHFMPKSLIHSQIETLESPKENENDILIIDASKNASEVLEECLKKIK